MQTTALRLEVFNASASPADARHEAVTLARKLETPVTFKYAESNYLILPHDTCAATCCVCYPSTKLPISKPEPQWESA